MASVYKTVSKKQLRQKAEEEQEPEDTEMQDLLAEADDTSDSEEDQEEEEETQNSSQKPSSGFMPKTRVLMLTSRGVTYRYVLQPPDQCAWQVLMTLLQPSASASRPHGAASSHP